MCPLNILFSPDVYFTNEFQRSRSDIIQVPAWILEITVKSQAWKIKSYYREVLTKTCRRRNSITHYGRYRPLKSEKVVTVLSCRPRQICFARCSAVDVLNFAAGEIRSCRSCEDPRVCSRHRKCSRKRLPIASRGKTFQPTRILKIHSISLPRFWFLVSGIFARSAVTYRSPLPAINFNDETPI